MPSQPNLAHLLPPSWKEDIPKWFQEDTPSFDWAGIVVGEEQQEAFLWAKSGVSDRWSLIMCWSAVICAEICVLSLQGVLAGVPFFTEIFKYVDCTWVHFGAP